MHNNGRHNRGELAKAEIALEEADAKYMRVKSLLEERKNERAALNSRIEKAGSAGNVDELIALQARRTSLDNSIAELSLSEIECHERVDSARRYLYKLYVRLERLRQEAAELSDDDRRQLVRVKVQIEAIAGVE